MKKLLILAALTFGSACATDVNTTYTVEQLTAQVQQVKLGPGALAVLTFPEGVKDVTVTRAGLVESKVSGNKVTIAGLVDAGSTPMQISTERHVYTLRVVMSGDDALSIVNINVVQGAAAPSTAAQLPSASVVPGLPQAARGAVVLPDPAHLQKLVFPSTPAPAQPGR